MKDKTLILYGCRLDSAHSPEKTSTLSLIHAAAVPEGTDCDDQARQLLVWLANYLHPATMACMDWDRDLAREKERLRAEVAEYKALNETFAVRLASCSDVLGRAAEKGKVSSEDVTRIIGECRCAIRSPTTRG